MEVVSLSRATFPLWERGQPRSQELSSSRLTGATEEKKWRKVDGPWEWGWGTNDTTTAVDFIHFASGTVSCRAIIALKPK